MRNVMQSAFTVREMTTALLIAEGRADLHELKPAQREIVERALEIIKGQ